jgi:hypothetical protein
MQKRVRGSSKKRKLFSCLFLTGVIVFLVYTYAFGGEVINPDDLLREDNTVVQTIPEGLAENEAYKIEACLLILFLFLLFFNN